MEIETEMVLQGEIAKEFFYQMMYPNLEAIKQRDIFLADAPRSYLNKDGILCFDIDDKFDEIFKLLDEV